VLSVVKYHLALKSRLTTEYTEGLRPHREKQPQNIILHAYGDDSGSTIKFKISHVGWTSVRQRGNKLPPTIDITFFPELSA